MLRYMAQSVALNATSYMIQYKKYSDVASEYTSFEN